MCKHKQNLISLIGFISPVLSSVSFKGQQFFRRLVLLETIVFQKIFNIVVQKFDTRTSGGFKHIYNFEQNSPVSNLPLPLIKALKTNFHRVSVHLKQIFTNTGGKVTQIWKLNNTQSRKQVIFSLEYFTSRLTLCKCVFSAFNQRSWRIRNWTIALSYIEALSSLHLKGSETCENLCSET